MNTAIPLPAGPGPPAKGPAAALPEGRPQPPPGEGFSGLVAGLLAPGLAGLPVLQPLAGRSGQPEAVPREAAEEAPGLDRSAEALIGRLPVAQPVIPPPAVERPQQIAAGFARLAPEAQPPTAASGGLGTAATAPAPVHEAPLHEGVARPAAGPIVEIAVVEPQGPARSGPAPPPGAAAADGAPPQESQVASIAQPRAVPAEVAAPRAAVRDALPEAAAVAGSAAAPEAPSGEAGGGGDAGPGGEHARGPRGANPAITNAPQSEHAAPVAFVATQGPAGPGGVADVAGPPALETSAEPEALVERLAETVERAVARGPRELRVVVRPPELGQLDIRVLETSEGVRVAIEASTSEVRALLEQQLPALRGALEGRELRIERLDVQQSDVAGSELADPGEEPRGRREAQGQAQNQPQNQETGSFAGAPDGAAESELATLPSSEGGQHVDVRA